MLVQINYVLPYTDHILVVSKVPEDWYAFMQIYHAEMLTFKHFSKLASTKFIEQLDLIAIDFKALKWHGLQFLRTWIAEFAAQAINVIYNGKQKLSQKLLFRFVSTNN